MRSPQKPHSQSRITTANRIAGRIPLRLELSKAHPAADAARSSGDPPLLLRPTKLLIASALRAMGRLRLLESAYAQSAELYRASLDFEDVPEAHIELAASSLLAKRPGCHPSCTTRRWHADPKNAQAYLILGRAFTAKQEYVKAAEALSQAAKIAAHNRDPLLAGHLLVVRPIARASNERWLSSNR